MSTLAAIIPAAGLSSRMGEFKPLLPLGEGTVLSQCVDLFRKNNIEQIVVVTGKQCDYVAAAAHQAGAVAVHNRNFEQGMYSSVLTGVRALKENVSAFFMLPVDIPLVRPETVGRLIEEFTQSAPSILYPRFRDERGHPPLISRSLVPVILSHDGTGGLRTVLDNHESGARDLDVADFGTVHDLDRPADYSLARTLADVRYPTNEECCQLWDMYSVPINIVRHCQAVSRVAEVLCERLNCQRNGNCLDIDLVRGAALTHDIGKGTRRHEIVGAERLQAHGFHDAATIALEHFDLTLSPEEPITEKEVVFLADKLVCGESPVPLKVRYMNKIELYRHEPGVEGAILDRLERATDIMTRFDREMGVCAEQLAQDVLA
nr:NTP transferase domain-containing protein [uncultured Pseudodesulfovibrio sp.]